MLPSLEHKLESDDITKWDNYNIIKALSDLINETKRTKREKRSKQ